MSGDPGAAPAATAVPNSSTHVLAPTDLASARAAMLDTAGPIAVAGAGTAARWAGALGPVETVLDTTGLTGVIAHNPGDMTVAVRAGMPLRELAAELAPHGQHVSLDAARVARGATVGGLVATGDAGPSALVYGSLRDLVIGITVVLADGTVARSGGHVIKNVAGYDLAKLLHGSYGTLAVLAEVVLRLHPVPRRTATVVLDCPLDEAGEHAARVLASPLEPVALEWCSAAGGSTAGHDTAGSGFGRLLVRLDGTQDALPGRVQRLRDLLGAAAIEAGEAGGTSAESHERQPNPAGAHHGAARSIGSAGAVDPWTAHADLVQGDADRAVLRIGVRPGLLPKLLTDLCRLVDHMDNQPSAADPGPERSVITAGLGTGVATIALPVDEATGADVVRRAHATVHAAGGTSVLRDRPAWLDAPAWGPPPSAVAVLRAVKRVFDPADRLGPGRFAPWFGTDSPEDPHP